MVYLYITKKSGTTDESVLMLAKEYRRAVGGGERELKIARTERGKPYFEGCDDIHFSVSHSGELFACAFAPFPIGLDIQEHVKRRGETDGEAKERCLKIAKRFFHLDEVDALELDTVSAFYKIWTAKESYVKLTGRGIDGEFADFCIFDLNSFLWQSEYGNYSISLCGYEVFEVKIIGGYEE